MGMGEGPWQAGPVPWEGKQGRPRMVARVRCESQLSLLSLAGRGQASAALAVGWSQAQCHTSRTGGFPQAPDIEVFKLQHFSCLWQGKHNANPFSGNRSGFKQFYLYCTAATDLINWLG